MRAVRITVSLMLVLMMCMLSAALAAEVEITFPNVNCRRTPGGTVVGRFAGGEVLTARDEVRRNGQLWYHVSSEQYGEGYVSAAYARPVRQGEYGADAVNADTLGFLEEWVTLHFDCGFCFWDDELGGRHYPEMDEAERARRSTPACRIRLAGMLFRYGFIWMTDDHARLNDPDRPEAEKAEIASRILKNHYGTDDIYTIIRECYGNDIPVADWHGGNPPVLNDADFYRCREVTVRVENRYGRNGGDSPELP